MGTMTGTWLLPDGVTPESGTVTFQLSARVVDTGTPAIVSEGPVTAHLDASGQISVELVATDDPSLQATGLAYMVTERLTAGRATYWIQPETADAPWDLADLAHYADPAPAVAHTPVPGPAGPAGPAGASGLSAHSHDAVSQV